MFLRRLFRRSAALDAPRAMERLGALGWFKYVSEAARPVVRDQVLHSLQRLRIPEADWLEDGELTPSTSDRRIYMADAEGLAEGDLHQVLLAMRDALSLEGVFLGEVVSDCTPQRYDLVVDGQRFEIFTPGVDPARSGWIVSVRLLEITDGLLQGAGSEARLYAQRAGGNEGAVMLLTPALHQELQKLGVHPDWIPQPLAVVRRG